MALEMPENPLRLIVLARDQSSRVQNAWRELSEFLGKQPGTQVAAAITDDLELGGLSGDLVVVLGGDGAILRACRQLGQNQLPILGVNLGRLGFLADLSPQEFRDNYEQIQTRNYHVVEQLMFECTLQRADGSRETCLGLNETAVNSAAALQMLDVELSINDEPVATYSCDGLIVSTPVGSTAHSLSAGGPILRQDLQAFVITPICPHTLTTRPLVDHADSIFQLSFPEVPEGAMLVVDGQIRRPLLPGDTVEVRRAPVTFKMAKIPGHSYYATLHRKLGWGGQLGYASP
jgi:NAD+ kinase